MKHAKRFCVFLLAACLLFGCACRSLEAPQNASDPSSQIRQTEQQSNPHTETRPQQTERQETHSDETQAFVEDPVASAILSLFPDADDLGILYNEPFRLGTPEAADIWCEGAFDRVFLIPRQADSYVRAYRVNYDDDGAMTKEPEPAFETYVKEQGDTVIAASLERPEGGPAWYVEIETPDAVGGMLLDYNGRYGTAQFEFLQAGPQADVSCSPEAELIGDRDYADFIRAAQAAGLTPAEAAKRFFSRLEEIGDGASFLRTSGGDTENGVCSFRCARFHENYYETSDSIEESVAEQYETYRRIGNELGILGPSFTGALPELYFELTGLAVYNRGRAAKEISVTVNGEDAGVFQLSNAGNCNLIPLSLQYPADKPVTVEIRVLSTWYGEAEQAILDCFPGLGGNISSAL